jgi:radical SAM superfamily enzyme YgiQ (UPF0313 family)
MRILVIATNQEKFPYPVMPIGASALCQNLSDNGHNVKFLDLMFIKNTAQRTTEIIKIFNPDVICISMRNLDNQILIAPEFYIRNVKNLIPQIRKTTNAKIITGGTGFTAEPVPVFEYLKPDFGIQGEAVKSINTLICNFTNRNIPGLVWRDTETGLTKINNIKQVQYAGNNQDKAIIKFISLKRYINAGSKIGIQTKTGCSRNCSYCDNFKMTSIGCRHLEIDSVIKQIKNIIETTGRNYFYFLDEIFSDNLKKTKLFLKKIINQNIKIRFEITDAPNQTDNEYAYLLKKAGCMGVMLGIDSGCDRMLKSYNKGFSTTDILNTANLLNRHNIPYYITVLLGGPGEDISTIQESVRFFHNLPKVRAVLINYGIRVLSGTGIAEYLKNKELLGKTDFLKPLFYLSKGFNKNAWKTIMKYSGKYNGWAVFNRIDSMLIKSTMNTVKHMLPEPQWKYAKTMSVFLKPLRKLLSLFVSDYKYKDLGGNIIYD